MNTQKGLPLSKIILDTDTCIYIINKNPLQVQKRLLEYNFSDVAVSSISVAELYFGAAKSKRYAENRKLLDHFLKPLQILPFDLDASATFADIKLKLEKNRNLIGAFDMLIASHALSRNLTLITNNIKDFGRIEGLNIENWYM